MDTPFEFLRRLDDDLMSVAKAEARRVASPSPKRRRTHWRGYAGVAAALLGLSFLIGLALEGGNGMRSEQFQSVGAAVNEPGIAAVPAASSAPLGQKRAADQSGFEKTSDTPGQAAASDLSKIIRDGQIAVTIDDGSFGSRSAEISHIAAANHGSVLSSSTSGGESGSFTLRIPAANFERAMGQLTELGTVDSSEIHGQDVTAEFVDLKAHMKIYLARRKVLFGLMLRANTIGETITLQNQLDDVQLRIDQISGQLNFINKQVAESTIKVDLHEPGAVAASTTSEVDNPSLGRAWDHAVQGFLNVLAAVTIGLGYLIPLLIIVAIGYAMMRFVQRRRPSAGDAG